VRKARGPQETGIHEPNMTPLIDVSLVLVVILMVATPMACQSSSAVSRAAASGQKAVPARTEWVEVTIESADLVLVNKQEVPRAALGSVLAARLEQSPTRRVLVRCADTVPHAAFVAVLDEAKSCGAAGIAVVGGNVQ
jgi:biopolymer transport protein ExbD